MDVCSGRSAAVAEGAQGLGPWESTCSVEMRLLTADWLGLMSPGGREGKGDKISQCRERRRVSMGRGREL